LSHPYNLKKSNATISNKTVPSSLHETRNNILTMPRQNSSLVATLGALLLSHAIHVHAFSTPSLPAVGSQSSTYCRASPFLQHSKSRRAFTTTFATKPNDNDVQQQEQQDAEADDDLLDTVTKAQLQDLCSQLDLKTTGTKLAMLQRLRQHASQQAELEHERTMARTQRVEEGSDDPKQRYEIVDESDRDYAMEEEDEDEEDDDGFFYFNTPEPVNTTGTDTLTPLSSQTRKEHTIGTDGSAIAAPPPPVEPNEDGERVVQIYSTTDQNDLTGIQAAQPGQGGGDAMSNSAGAESTTPQPWDMDQSATRSGATEQEMDQAKGQVIELCQALLAMSGAPAFRGFAEDLESLPTFEAPKDFVGFNPGQVSTELLTSSSQALRTGRGQVLQDVLRDFEMQGIGQDGMAGDKIESGGGHYREVTKVRAFLEGYRRAEVRRLARETTALLLDKLVVEGVGGLDLTLATMTRSSDDTSDYAGELNDSLLDYLNDAIRQQEKKVDQMVKAKMDALAADPSVHQEHDPVDGLWNVTTNEDGQRVESIDPNDPAVQQVLQEEYNRNELLTEKQGDSAPEKLLLLLTLLRQRMEAEAKFAPDEKGRNLRLLAYCLQVSTDGEREQLIMNDIGNSLDVR
jgi:hypothetical protein